MSVTLPTFAAGALRVNVPVFLAPMSGVTDSPFRRVVKEASGDAVGLVVSEFISVEMLTRRTMKSVLRMAFDASERPVVVQIFGAEPARMAEAARIIADAGADGVDVNAGCPAPKVTKKGGGAGLLRDLPLLGRIVEAVATAVDVPVGVKIRNGWCDASINALETLHVAEESGAAMIAVHGRTRAQLYRGEADWDVVREMAARARVPVIGSGDVATSADVVRRFSDAGCDAVMIGRAAITNPWIFRQVQDELAGRAPFEPTWDDRLALLERYRELLAATYPARMMPGRMRMMLSRLLKARPESHAIRVPCLREPTPRAMLDRLAAFLRAEGLVSARRAA